jgi:hypothetical protein
MKIIINSRHFCILCLNWRWKHFKHANHTDELATCHSHWTNEMGVIYEHNNDLSIYKIIVWWVLHMNLNDSYRVDAFKIKSSPAAVQALLLLSLKLTYGHIRQRWPLRRLDMLHFNFCSHRVNSSKHWNKTTSKASHKQMQITNGRRPFASELLPALFVYMQKHRIKHAFLLFSKHLLITFTGRIKVYCAVVWTALLYTTV